MCSALFHKILCHHTAPVNPAMQKTALLSYAVHPESLLWDFALLCLCPVQRTLPTLPPLSWGSDHLRRFLPSLLFARCSELLLPLPEFQLVPSLLLFSFSSVTESHSFVPVVQVYLGSVGLTISLSTASGTCGHRRSANEISGERKSQTIFT